MPHGRGAVRPWHRRRPAPTLPSMMDALAHDDLAVAEDLLSASDALLGQLEELNLLDVEYPPAELRRRALRLFALSGMHPSSGTVQGLLDGVFDAQLWILSMRRRAPRCGMA